MFMWCMLEKKIPTWDRMKKQKLSALIGVSSTNTQQKILITFFISFPFSLHTWRDSNILSKLQYILARWGSQQKTWETLGKCLFLLPGISGSQETRPYSKKNLSPWANYKDGVGFTFILSTTIRHSSGKDNQWGTNK